MKGTGKKCSLIALAIAFVASFTMAFAVIGNTKALADANIYETGINATTAVVEKEGKTAYQINLAGGYGCRVANSVACDLANLEFDLYDVSAWTVGEGANSLFIAYTDGFNRFYNEEYVNGVTVGLYHTFTGEAHSYKLVLYKGWVAAPFVNGSAWYETPAVTDPAGDKLTVSFYMNDDNSAWVMDLNDQTVSVPAELFTGSAPSFYPEENVSMNNVYMMVSSMSKGTIVVSANRKAIVDENAYKAALAVVAEYKALAQSVADQTSYEVAVAKRAEIDLTGIFDDYLADVNAKIAEADIILDENLSNFSFDNRIPFSIGSGAPVGSRLINVNGVPAYRLGMGKGGGFAYRISSTESYDLTTLSFDILRASSSIIETTTAGAQHTFIAFTDGVNRYNTEYKGGLTLSFEHAVADGHHTYKLLFNQGWFEGNVWLQDANSNLYTLLVTDPADDALKIKFQKSENNANLIVSMNDQSVALPMTLFGTGGRMYTEFAEAINNVYFIYGTMNTAVNSMVIANLTDSKTEVYKNGDAYKTAFGKLASYTAALDNLTSYEQLIAAIEDKNSISVTGLRSYDANYVNWVLATYDGRLADARKRFAANLLDYDISAYESAVSAISTVEDSFAAKAKKELIDKDLLADSEDAQKRVAEADAVFVEKTDAVAKALSASALANIKAAKYALDVYRVNADLVKFTPDYMGFLSAAAVTEVNKTLAEINNQKLIMTSVTDWSTHGNAITVKTPENELNFIGSAYAGINESGALETQNDAMFYGGEFQITNFCMNFKLKPGLTEGWFSVALMANENDIFSASGEGEAFCGKHKGLIIWLQPKTNNKVVITVFAVKDDSLQIYAARKTDALEMEMPADGKFNLRMYQAEGANELTMLLNGTNILNSKVRIPELNNIYGPQKNAADHKGHLAIIGCVSNQGEYFDFTISNINNKNVFDSEIETPDPSNVPAKEECKHEYDPETGYCSKCGEKDPNFVEPSSESENESENGSSGTESPAKKGCKGSVGAVGILAVLASVGAAIVCKKRKD